MWGFYVHHTMTSTNLAKRAVVRKLLPFKCHSHMQQGEAMSQSLITSSLESCSLKPPVLPELLLLFFITYFAEA